MLPLVATDIQNAPRRGADREPRAARRSLMVIIDTDPETGVVVGTASGLLTPEEIRRAAASVWRDVEGPCVRVLWDLRKARFEFSAVEVRALAEFARQNSPYPDLRMAFVVARDLEFGLVRIFEALRETARAQVAVFREKDEALAWLAGGVA